MFAKFECEHYIVEYWQHNLNLVRLVRRTPTADATLVHCHPVSGEHYNVKDNIVGHD